MAHALCQARESAILHDDMILLGDVGQEALGDFVRLIQLVEHDVDRGVGIA